MTVAAGRILLHDHVVEGWMQLDGTRVVAWDEGTDWPEKPSLKGWISPTAVNAHSHIGDTFLRGEPGKPTRVADLVGPGGWKHRQLAQADPKAMAKGVRQALAEMARTRVSHFLDFREGGVAGARWLAQSATTDGAPEPVLYGRLEAGESLRDLFAVAAGYGLSGVRDIDPDVAADIAAACRRVDRPLAVHVSEDVRDPPDTWIDLDPAFVVHMTQARRGDLRLLAEADIPLVVCPRSNRFFGLDAPVAAAREVGATLAVGTDNGMLHPMDVWEELRLWARLDPASTQEARLRALTHGGHHVRTGSWPANPGRDDTPWMAVAGKLK